MRAGWTASGACTSGSIARRRGVTKPVSGGVATTSTAAGWLKVFMIVGGRLGGAEIARVEHQRQADVFLRGQRGDQVEGLKDEADFFSPYPRQRFVAQ